MSEKATVSAAQVKELRERTRAGVMQCKSALEDTQGDLERAVALLEERGLALAEEKAHRETTQGLIECYIHAGGRVGSMVEVNCETDFVARTEDFQALAKDLALHIASAKPLAVTVEDMPADVVQREKAIFEAQVAESGKPEQVRAKIVEGKLKKFYQEHVLLEQAFVKDDTKTIGDLVKAASGKLGENVMVRRFARFELGA